MKKNIIFIMIFIAGCMHLTVFCLSMNTNSRQVKTGELLPRIDCVSDPDTSYALYLPSSYSEKKKWPLIFCLDPGARGKLPVELLQKAAEKYGYILVGSNNSKNGPWEPTIKVIKKTWQDITSRFSINLERVYTTGFSGGSRAAAAFPVMVQKNIAGIIGCGAGIPSGMKPYQIKATSYFGIVGYYDFNYREMVDLEFKLKDTAIYHRMDYFDGDHRWPDQNQMTDAVEWFELLSMKSGLTAIETSFIKDYFAKRIARAQAIQQKNRIAAAATEYNYLIKDFSGLQPVTEIQSLLNKLESSPEYKIALEEKKNTIIAEYNYESRFKEIFTQIERSEITQSLSSEFLKKLGVEDLVAQSRSKTSFNQSAMAERLLSILSVKAQKFGSKAKKNNDLNKCVLYFEVFRIATKNHANSFYYLASVHSYFKKKPDALRYLKLALDNGFKYPQAIVTSPDFDFIRQTPEYISLMKRFDQKN